MSDRYIPPKARGGESPRYDQGGSSSGYGRPRGGGRGDGDNSGRYGQNRDHRRDRDEGGFGGNRSPGPARGGIPRPSSPFRPIDLSEGEPPHPHGNPHFRAIDRLKSEEMQRSMPRVASMSTLQEVEKAERPVGTIPRVASQGSLREPKDAGMKRVNSVEALRERDRDDAPSPHPRGSPTQRGRFTSTPVPVVWSHWEPADSVKNMTETEINKIRDNMLITIAGEPPIANPATRFDELNIDQRILKDIASHNYIRPTPIQSQALPVLLSGRHVLGFAETGSGKTAAFCIPMISHILHQPPLGPRDGPIGLVLAPTRELAQQIDKEAKMFSISSKLRGTIVVGGSENMHQQRTDLRSGVEYVVATPGRFIQHLQQGNTSLNRCSYLVLDEADRMLDMGFEDQMREIINRIPRDRQTLLFSATMPEEIEALAREYLQNPVRISIGTVNKPTANVEQHLEFVPEDRKLDKLIDLITCDEDDAEVFRRDQPQILVFVETKIKCEEICSILRQKGFHADRLHADRTQPQREAALQAYRNGEINVLMATDLASRGLDVQGITHVINYDLPRKMEDYVHRIGRTGRAGMSGKATSFYDDRDMDIALQIRRAINDAKNPSEARADSPALFAAGKAARRREKAEKEAEKQKRREAQDNVAGLAVDDKYRHMLMQPVRDESSAAPVSDAWDD